MTRRPFVQWALTLLALALVLAALAPASRAQQMFVMPSGSDTVDKAISAENLKAAAAKTADPQVLLGLAFLAQTGSPVRQEIAQMAVKAKPEYAPIAALLVVSMDGIDEKSVAEMIKCDPDSALGYYLQGNLLYQSAKEKEALDAYRKAAARSELRLYESTTCEALFKALDALNLQGRDRLCALSWMASRTFSSGIVSLQASRDALSELARGADIGTRKEISELFLVMAGQLYATNFRDRQYADWYLEQSFRLKAEVAFDEKSLAANGYAAASRAAAGTSGMNWPGIEEDRTAPLELARYAPSRIHDAFQCLDPAQVDRYGKASDLPENDRTAFTKAVQELRSAAMVLVDTASDDPDGIMGAYLKGLPPPRPGGRGPGVSTYSYVEGVMRRRPDVFRAVAAFEQAQQAVSEVRKNDPWRRNDGQIMRIGPAIMNYLDNHEGTFPESLEGRLAVEAKSIVTGRPYVYVAAGEKAPQKAKEFGEFIVLYDDEPHSYGVKSYYRCLFADCHVGSMPVEKVMEQLNARGKGGRQGAGEP